MLGSIANPRDTGSGCSNQTSDSRKMAESRCGIKGEEQRRKQPYASSLSHVKTSLPPAYERKTDAVMRPDTLKCTDILTHPDGLKRTDALKCPDTLDAPRDTQV